MADYGHFIGGKHVAGTSGRFADVFAPDDGRSAGRGGAGLAPTRSAPRSQNAARGAARLGRRQPAAPRPRHHEVPRARPSRTWRSSPSCSPASTARPSPDAKGDIQRGYEVVEFACGIPHLLKGEFTDGAGPGIDAYSMRQPLGVTAGITPFNFPAMIPMWKFAPAIACGNCLHPEAVRARPRRADAPRRTDDRGGPAGRRAQRRQRRQGRGRRPARRSRTSRPSASSARRPSPNTSTRAAPRRGSASMPSAAPRTTWSSCRTPTWTRPSMR